MKSLWRIFRIATAVVGGFLIYAGTSKSDYHVIELGQSTPDYAWRSMFIGAILLLPTVIHIIKTERSGYEI